MSVFTSHVFFWSAVWQSKKDESFDEGEIEIPKVRRGSFDSDYDIDY